MPSAHSGLRNSKEDPVCRSRKVTYLHTYTGKRP
ncbi:hypothetical protein PDIG_30390 [Penicillium digitatum PHI26]|uniref:Uncharacterized protein n=2 Tax=Penicillium digitatum TaxID=36651 RepID=K9FZ39_PEND2|nr:hypothetical protein PDIP_64770 [Penicillium digitatum Pd1]EKV09395.1 hypothetical protein PDIP_64770 [Penicillium digitatum Pd1]EKV14960.1 hypothetical protein PDIG_30390 [Penicillium digitatum PHI26]